MKYEIMKLNEVVKGYFPDGLEFKNEYNRTLAWSRKQAIDVLNSMLRDDYSEVFVSYRNKGRLTINSIDQYADLLSLYMVLYDEDKANVIHYSLMDNKFVVKKGEDTINSKADLSTVEYLKEKKDISDKIAMDQFDKVVAKIYSYPICFAVKDY